MSNELTIRASLSFEKGGSGSLDVAEGPTDFDVTGYNAKINIQDVGFAAEELLDLGDVAAGYVFVKNLDATNYVQIRPGSGLQALIRLLPGRFCLFPLDAGATPYVIANTAACRIKVAAVDA